MFFLKIEGVSMLFHETLGEVNVIFPFFYEILILKNLGELEMSQKRSARFS
jgi:hypothetical protein